MSDPRFQVYRAADGRRLALAPEGGELGDSGNPLSVVKGGADQGTYLAEPLVVA